MTKPLLIMKTGNTIGPLRELGVDFEDWFREGLGLSAQEVVVVSVHQGQQLPAPDSISAVVITGSAAYVTDLEEWNFIAGKFIKEVYTLQTPMLGVCYGHQLIAWAFGGTVDFHARGREIGTVSVELSAAAQSDRLFQGLPKTIAVNVSHQQSVIELPAEAVRLASNGFEPNHGFRLGEFTWGVQFHPEFSQEIIRAYILARHVDIDAEGLDAHALSHGALDTPASAGILRRFMSIVRTSCRGPEAVSQSA
jgi:GMP synthase (glutamine-hydrolysing)